MYDNSQNLHGTKFLPNWGKILQSIKFSDLSMGCKLSPYLANIFMCDLEEKIKKSKFFPTVWHRYVDDIFCIVNPRILNTLLNFLNSLHPSLKFTLEKEENRKIAFLDLHIEVSEEQDLVFSIYRKPTHTGR